MLTPGRTYTGGTGYRYGFNGKENDNEVEGVEGSQQDYGMRIYNPRVGRFLSTDPISARYPELTPYQFASNTPLQAIDLDGLEAVHWTKWLGFTQDKPKLKPGEWYEIHSYVVSYVPHRSIDEASFKQAAIFNANTNRSYVYQNIEQRHEFYRMAQTILDERKTDSKWFKAAGIVTQMNAVGAADIDVINYLGKETANFLSEGNQFLFTYNMDNFRQLINNKHVLQTFTTAKSKDGTKETIDMQKLNGKELDYALVKYEQSLVQEFIDGYKKDHPSVNMQTIAKKINNAFGSMFAPEDVRDVLKTQFTDKGKKFDFQSYDDRVKLGQGLVDKVRSK